MTNDTEDLDDLFAAIDRAGRQAREDHKVGACADSEWSCSYCDATETRDDAE